MGKSTALRRVHAESPILSVGIDISKETFNVALYGVDAAGADRYHNHTFANSESGIKSFLHLLQKQQATTAPLCMEATGRYWEALAFALSQAGLCVSVVNPARLRAYVTAAGKRTKTDKADAQYIAHFCAKQTPDPWLPPTPERRELQALSRHLDDLKQERTRHRNRLQALPPSPLVRQSLAELVRQLDEQIAEVEAEIERLSSTSAEFAAPMDLLCSIPGIGVATAAHLLAEMPAITNFASVRQLSAYAGLNPAIRQSGKSLHKGSLAKQGNRHLRTALFYPALSAMRHNPLVKPLVTRMLERGKAKKQCVAAAMRKLLHIVYGVLKSGKPFNPTLDPTPGLT
jgi:transposase